MARPFKFRYDLHGAQDIADWLERMRIIREEKEQQKEQQKKT